MKTYWRYHFENGIVVECKELSTQELAAAVAKYGKFISKKRIQGVRQKA